MTTAAYTYPKFKKLGLADRDLFRKITSKYPPYSDFNFTSLWAYNKGDFCEFSILNGNLVIKYKDYITDEPFFSFLGKNKVTETIHELMSMSGRHGFSPKLKLVPEINLAENAIVKNRFTVLEDIDSFDYIISADKLAKLEGTAFHSYRKEIKNFLAKHPSTHVKRIDIADKDVQKEIMEIFKTWAKQKGITDAENDNELLATQKLLSAGDTLDTISYGLYVNGKLISYCISEFIHQNYVMGHFKKADKNYVGAYRYISHITAKEFKNKGFDYINYEQDLGIAGLKTSKALAHPVHFLKKYIISR